MIAPSDCTQVKRDVRAHHCSEAMIPAPSSPLRILITTGIFPPDIGGPATYVPTMASALGARGCHVTVVTLSDVPGEEAWGPDIPVVRLPRWRPRLLRTLQLLRRLRQAGKPSDVFFAVGLPIETALAATWLRKPCVMRIGGDLAWERALLDGSTADALEVFQGSRQRGRIEVYRRLQRWAVRRAVRVITPSEYLKRIVAGWGIPADRIRVIRSPADLPELTAEIAGVGRQGRRPLDSIRIVTGGRLVPLKRVDSIIRAVSRLPEVELVVVGDGPERGRLEAVARSTQARVQFVGAVPRHQALTILRGADVAILNSISEGFPHFVLEAMALGVPVIASAAGGVQELVRDGETGILLPCGTEDEIAGAVKRLAEDPGLRRRVVQGARDLVAGFDLNAATNETLAVLAEASRPCGAPAVGAAG